MFAAERNDNVAEDGGGYSDQYESRANHLRNPRFTSF